MLMLGHSFEWFLSPSFFFFTCFSYLAFEIASDSHRSITIHLTMAPLHCWETAWTIYWFHCIAGDCMLILGQSLRGCRCCGVPLLQNVVTILFSYSHLILKILLQQWQILSYSIFKRLQVVFTVLYSWANTPLVHNSVREGTECSMKLGDQYNLLKLSYPVLNCLWFVTNESSHTYIIWFNEELQICQFIGCELIFDLCWF